MSDLLCGYRGDREAMLMAYLYEEIGAAEKAEFDAHLATCARCRVELSSFGAVRKQLAQWAPPAFAHWNKASSGEAGSALAHWSSTTDDGRRTTSHGSWWREIPAWAQVAAAALFIGVSAGIANLDVRYDGSGLHVRTGWSRGPGNPANPANRENLANLVSPVNPANLVTRTDLAALERQLRNEFRMTSSSASPVMARAAAADGDVMRRARALVDESERRQQRELALRVAELVRDVNAQRQADLRKIDQNLGIIENRTGVEVLKNRQTLDLLLQRVSLRQ